MSEYIAIEWLDTAEIDDRTDLISDFGPLEMDTTCHLVRRTEDTLYVTGTRVPGEVDPNDRLKAIPMRAVNRIKYLAVVAVEEFRHETTTRRRAVRGNP